MDGDGSDNSATSISTLLLGLDYIFYVWTFLLVGLVAYLSIYKYFQLKRTQIQSNVPAASGSPQKSGIANNQTVTLSQETSQGSSREFLDSLVKYVKIAVNLTSSLCLYINGKCMSLNQMFPFGSRAQPAYYGWLNNCLKWFYFNSETTKLINRNILKKLNNVVNFSRTSYRQKARKSYLVSKNFIIYLNKSNWTILFFKINNFNIFLNY